MKEWSCLEKKLLPKEKFKKRGSENEAKCSKFLSLQTANFWYNTTTA